MWEQVNQINAMIKDKSIIFRGLQLANVNRVTKIVETYDKDNLKRVSAVVIGDTDVYNTMIAFNGAKVYGFFCNCMYCHDHRTPCKHVVALSNVYATQNTNSVKGFNKAPAAKVVDKNNIFSTYNSLFNDLALSEAARDVIISPYLLAESGRLSVRFKVGREKLYVIKDIAEFVYRFDINESYRYGVNFDFVHDEKSLLGSAQEYLLYMRSATLLANESRAKGSSVTAVEKLPFASWLADFIFEQSKSGAITFQDNKTNVIFSEEPKKIELLVQKKSNNYFFLYAGKKFYIYNGDKYCYVYYDDVIYRRDLSAYKIISPLANELNISKSIFESEHESLGILMTEQHLSEWISNISPLLEPYFNIVYEDIDTHKYEPLPLVAELYLDLDEKRIVGELKCFYGDERVDIYSETYLSSGKGVRLSEAKVKVALDKYFLYIGGEHIIASEDTQYEFLNSGMAELEKVCDIFASTSFDNFSVVKKPTVNVGIKLDGELLDIDVTFDGEYTSAEIFSILQAYKAKKKYVKVSSNKFVDLNGADYDVLDDVAEISGNNLEKVIDGSVTANKFRALHLDNAVKSSDINFTRNAQFKELVKSVKSFEDADFALDKTLDKKLRHYQKVGFRWFKSLSHYGFGGILADDMGLGKSVQTIAFLQSLNGVSIVVCPSSLILNWKNEFEKFAPQLNIACIYGSKFERGQLIDDVKNANVVVTSYEILKKDIDSYKDIMFEAAILDEGQYIKNHITLNAKAVKGIKSKYRFALTGTPIENNIAELWSIFDFIMPGYLYNYNKFKTTFENKIIKEQDAAATERLRQMVTPFILRRLKKDVLKELPPKVDNLIAVTLEGEQRALYAANLAVIKGEIEGIQDYNKGKFMVLSYLLKLRQICCSPSLIAENYNGNSAKMDECMEIISSSVANGHKILVFSQFTSLLAIIKQKLIDGGISHFLLQGDTKREDRMKMVDAFNADNTSVFLLSLKAGGTGLNLTAADIVIHYDPWWNLSVQNQATDRAHRIGQNKSVQVYRLILKDTIEEKIVQLQARKQELFDSIIKEGEVDFTKMSREQLLDLLST